jgi:carboxymethylenebutenolidase
MVSDSTPYLIPAARSVTDAHLTVPVAEIELGPYPRGAVLLLSPAEDPAGTTQVMNRLAEHGYETLAVDLTTVTNAPHWIELMLKRLADRGWSHEQIGVVGYRAGAELALHTAAVCGLGAAVSVDIGDSARAQPGIEGALRLLQTPWLGLAAAPRPQTAGTHLASRWRHLRCTAAVYSQFVCYPGVLVGYSTDSGDARAHAAAFDSWQRTLEWLDARVVPRLTPQSKAWRATLGGSIGAP